MCTPLRAGSRSTKQSISAETSASRPPCCMRTAFCTPVTPARESPSCTSGTEACMSTVPVVPVSLRSIPENVAAE